MTRQRWMMLALTLAAVGGVWLVTAANLSGLSFPASLACFMLSLALLTLALLIGDKAVGE